MKHIIYLATVAILLLGSCTKQVQTLPVEQYDGYIFFSQDVETKATLIGSKDKIDKFGVVGFKYDNTSSWNSHVSSDPSPNVFQAGTMPQIVTCDDNGYGTYSPLQGWSNTLKYSFFAYYPVGNPYVSLVNGTGVPSIKYSVNTNDLKSSMVDVMMARSLDQEWSSDSPSDGNVALGFEHCLSCLAIKIKNNTTAPLRIMYIIVEISGLHYKEITIPLDGGATEAVEENLFGFFSLMPNASERTIAVGGETELSDKLILIPQSENISIQLQINYNREASEGFPGSENSIRIPLGTSDENPQYLRTSLTKGTKHLIQLNFKDSTVEAQMGSGAWNDPISIGSTFN